ncbi:MAG: cardiolipin synthase [Bacteriovoracia bacterium]
MLKAFIIISYLMGIYCAAMAILRSRTPQGATAWVMSLLSFPFISVPAYFLLGRNKFEGYNTKRRILDRKIENELIELAPLTNEFIPSIEEMKVITRLVSPKNQPGFTRGNRIKLLVDADEAFPEMLEEIEKAREYIIFQFYVVRGDETGCAFLNALIRKAKAGVKVTFMNDAIGVEVPKPLMKRMIDAGIETGTFNESTHKGKLQINFRNHRKILVIDGRVAFIGGMNIGDEYRGLTIQFGPWRDTSVRLEGPAVIAAQLACAKDWYCIHEKPIKVNWNIHGTKSDSTVMVLHSGPADEKHTILLSLISLINMATERLWIANPYYVPPESLMDAILLASLRGVDVKILVPSYSDATFVMLASKVYQKPLLKHGVKLYRYTPGFLHQKVMLVDDQFAVVGSANFDCRSMFINFEVSVISNDKNFVTDCAKMLEKDFSVSEEVFLKEFREVPIFQKILTRAANLLAPVL